MVWGGVGALDVGRWARGTFAVGRWAREEDGAARLGAVSKERQYGLHALLRIRSFPRNATHLTTDARLARAR